MIEMSHPQMIKKYEEQDRYASIGKHTNSKLIDKENTAFPRQVMIICLKSKHRKKESKKEERALTAAAKHQVIGKNQQSTT